MMIPPIEKSNPAQGCEIPSSIKMSRTRHEWPGRAFRLFCAVFRPARRLQGI